MLMSIYWCCSVNGTMWISLYWYYSVHVTLLIKIYVVERHIHYKRWQMHKQDHQRVMVDPMLMIVLIYDLFWLPWLVNVSLIALIDFYFPDCPDWFRLPWLPWLVYIALIALIGLDCPDWFRMPWLALFPGLTWLI